MQPLVVFCTVLKVHPLILTVIGFLFAAWAASWYILGRFFWAGVVLLAGGVFDSIDGEVARQCHRASPLGAFMDSVLDRLSEIIVLLSLIWYFLETDPVVALVTAVFLAASLLVSYAKARAESLGIECRTGIMQRPERVVLLGLASLFGGYVVITVLYVLATVTVLTVFQRLYHVTRKLV